VVKLPEFYYSLLTVYNMQFNTCTDEMIGFRSQTAAVQITVAVAANDTDAIGVCAVYTPFFFLSETYSFDNCSNFYEALTAFRTSDLSRDTAAL
jgi:hypothetical protein